MTKAATLLGYCFLLLIWQPALADPILWEARGEQGSSLFLAGSVRALPESAYPLPDTFQKAYEASPVLVFETDLGYLHDLETQSKIGLAGSYPQGTTTLQQELPAPQFQRLQTTVSELGVPLFTVNNYKPWLAGVLVEMAAFAGREYWPEQSVDLHFFNRATEDGKRIRNLAPVEAYAAQLTGMPEKLSEDMLSLLLDEIERFNGPENSLVEYWMAGDEEGLSAYIASQKAQYPALYAHLLVKNVESWMATFAQILASKENAMVIVSAASLHGPEGILAGLRKQGISVKAMQ